MPSIDGAMLDGTPDSAMPIMEPDSSPPMEASPPPQDSSAPGTPETGAPEATAPESSVPDTSVPETSTTSCVATPSAGSLPFAVDTSGVYVTSGYEGDSAAISMPLDPTCGGNRSSATAMGNCHPVTYTPPPSGSALAAWSGVLWQHPTNNWGNLGAGFAMPAGATKVSLWARGQLGGEVATFLAGFDVTPTATNPCVDTVTGSLRVTLTTTWTHYTIPLAGQYPLGIISPFGYTVAIADQPLRDGGAATSVVFYIDDIEWQP
jgi:hypothetical protein